MINRDMDGLVKYLMHVREVNGFNPPTFGVPIQKKPMFAQATTEEAPTADSPQGNFLFRKLKEMLGPTPTIPSDVQNELRQLDEEEKIKPQEQAPRKVEA